MKKAQQIQQKKKAPTKSKMEEAKYQAQIPKQYKNLQYIAHGKFGYIFKGKDTKNKNETVALKIISKRGDEKDPKRFERLWKKEINILKTYFGRSNGKCPHPHVVCYYNHHENKDYFIIVMGYLEGFTWKSVIKHTNKSIIEATELLIIKRKGKIVLTESELYVVQQELISLFIGIKQLLMAVEYMHSKKLAHRDIHPGNIFMDRRRKNLTLLDFGLACIAVDKPKTSKKKRLRCPIKNLTPFQSLYTAPEILKTYISRTNKKVKYVYFPRNIFLKADLWSIGITLYNLIFKKDPYNTRKYTELFSRFKESSDKNKILGKMETLLRMIGTKSFIDSKSKITIIDDLLNKHLLVEDQLKRSTAKQALEFVEKQLEQLLNIKNVVKFIKKDVEIVHEDLSGIKSSKSAKSRLLSIEPTPSPKYWEIPINVAGMEDLDEIYVGYTNQNEWAIVSGYENVPN